MKKLQSLKKGYNIKNIKMKNIDAKPIMKDIYLSKKDVFFIILAFLIILVFYLLPTPAGLTFKGQIMIGILLGASILWITEPIPLAVTGLLIIILQPLLGILPAVISPYVIPKIGFSNATRFFLSGERFDAEKAYKIGLIHELVNDIPELDQKIVNVIHRRYGLPRGKQGRDIWYIKCANVTTIRYILSEDMHLYDPKLKEIIKGEHRIKFMQDRKGALLKFLEKKL